MNEDTISLRSYITGFILSAILVLAAYCAVVFRIGSVSTLITIIFVLAIVQIFVQLRYFLHVSTRSKSRMQLSILIFAIIGIGILVSGSLWIMYHLNYNMTTSDQTQIIMQEEGMQNQ